MPLSTSVNFAEKSLLIPSKSYENTIKKQNKSCDFVAICCSALWSSKCIQIDVKKNLRTSAYGPAQAQPPRACTPNKSFNSADTKLWWRNLLVSGWVTTIENIGRRSAELRPRTCKFLILFNFLYASFTHSCSCFNILLAETSWKEKRRFSIDFYGNFFSITSLVCPMFKKFPGLNFFLPYRKASKMLCGSFWGAGEWHENCKASGFSSWNSWWATSWSWSLSCMRFNNYIFIVWKSLFQFTMKAMALI